MDAFGFSIVRKQAETVAPGRGGWWSVVREAFTGAWQQNVEVNFETVLTYPAVFRCISIISSDIGKMRMRLITEGEGGIWSEVENPAFSPVLRKPNRYQTHIQFFSNWMESKLMWGNTYVLKERDNRGVVVRLYVLDPSLVTVLVAEDGSVLYDLRADRLAGIPEGRIAVPARDIIHDRWNTIYHPLVGTSPIHAAGVAAMQGNRIQNLSTQFFANGASPGGVLYAPTKIAPEQMQRLRDDWDTKYGAGGTRIGKVAVLEAGMRYEQVMMTAQDAQLLEQLKWSAETVASVFGVPAYMIGIGSAPSYNNIEALILNYYTQGLQIHIESIRVCMNEGLELPKAFGVEFDLDDLLRMDSATKMKVASDGVKSSIFAPNEARAKFDMKPVAGGETPYLQEQNWPLRHLAERPLPSRKPTPPAEIPADADGTPSPGGESDLKQFCVGEIIRRSHPYRVRRAT